MAPPLHDGKLPASWAIKSIVAGAAGLAVCRSIIRYRRHFSWEGKTVLVTGGSRGLGLVLARQLAHAGARVAICARTETDLQAAHAELSQIGPCLALRCDVRDPAAVTECVARVAREWGDIEVLFNVAGVMEVGPLESMTHEDFKNAMDTHFWGPLHMIQAVLPAMRHREWGRIVNISSIGGKMAVPHMTPYCASKFALVGLSQGLRTELAKDNILVTTVCPSLMRTGSARNASFKSQHRKEYAWFSIAGSLPIISKDADRSARRILQACQSGEVEVAINNHLNPAVAFHRLFPKVTTQIMSWVNQLLPDIGGIGPESAKGYESESRISPSWLTALADGAARANNEMR